VTAAMTVIMLTTGQNKCSLVSYLASLIGQQKPRAFEPMSKDFFLHRNQNS
jgi:hypothetical protein